MEPRITVITLGVDDLEKSLAFYRDGLGLPTQGIFGTEFEYGAVAFFDLNAGMKLAIWPRKSIPQDTGITLGHHKAAQVATGRASGYLSAFGYLPFRQIEFKLQSQYVSNFTHRQFLHIRPLLR